MPHRSYGQHCALAKSLDLVGDRWTLLVVRELLDRPHRYKELLSALAPIATDMLAGRLRDLERNGLVRRRELATPASGTVYELTDAGLALEDVINAFARWGRHLLTTREPRDVVRPQWLARALRAYLRPDRSGPDMVVRLATPQGGTTLRITADAVEDADGADADVLLTGDVEALGAALDPHRVPALISAGRLYIAGDPSDVNRLAAMLLPPRVRG